MKILFLSPWLPWPPFDGARIRILETLRYLSSRHRVVLLATVRHPGEVNRKSALTGLCERIITTVVPDTTWTTLRRLSHGLIHGMPFIQGFHYDTGLAQEIRELTTQNEYDIIHIEFPFLASYLRCLKPGTRSKKVLSMHNLETMRFRRELHVSPWSRRRLLLLSDSLLFDSWEEKSFRLFDGITVVSKLEQDWVRGKAPGAIVELVPNGVDVRHFSTESLPGSGRCIAFTGAMDYPPNVDAAVWFCDEILPIIHRTHPDVSFKIIGTKPDRKVLSLAGRSGVEVTGEVPDIRPYLSDCLALAVPLRSGGGTRLKILQAMAMGRPVVSTRLGAEGLDVTYGADILLGESPQELADHILSILSDSALGERLSRAGRKLVETRYDWRTCLTNLENLYEKILLGSN